MLVLESSDRLLLETGDRFPVGALDNDGAAGGTGVLGLWWSRAVGGAAPERVTCPVEELEPPAPEFSAEVTAAAIIVRGSAPGAVRLAVSDLGRGGRPAETDIADTGEIAVPLESGRTEYRLRAAVRNSRGAELAEELTVGTPGTAVRLRAVKDPPPLKFFSPDERISFAARLTLCPGGRLPRRDEVESCRCAAYRLVKNSRGVGRVPCNTPFGAGAELPVSVVSDTLSAAPPWRRDRAGGNFLYAPDLPVAELCGGPGFYDVVFTVRLKSGGSVSFEFSVPVARVAGPGARAES